MVDSRWRDVLHSGRWTGPWSTTQTTKTKLDIWSSEDQDTTYRHSPTYTTFTLRKCRRKSNFVQIGIEYTYIWINIFVYARQSKWNPSSSTQERNRQQHDPLPPCRLCYHPAVFLRHLLLIVFLFQQGKIPRAFHKCYFLIFFICFLYFLKLRKSGSVSILYLLTLYSIEW